MRRGAITAAALALLAGSARAEEQSCLDAAVRGQELMKDRRLLEAREALAACTRESCPGLVRRDCTGWLAQVEQTLPSLILAVRDEAGRDVVDARVVIDGRPVPNALEGRAISVDPGKHVIDVERAGDLPLHETVVAREGERQRSIALRLVARQPAPAPVESTASVPWTVYALAGAGAVAAGIATYFGVGALSERATKCDAANACSQSTADDILRSYTVAEIAAGAAVLSLAGAAWIFFRRGPARVGAGPGPSVSASASF